MYFIAEPSGPQLLSLVINGGLPSVEEPAVF